MCARQHTFHSRGSLLPTRDDTDGVPHISLWYSRLPISVLELTKNEVDGGVVTLAKQFARTCVVGEIESYTHTHTHTYIYIPLLVVLDI